MKKAGEEKGTRAGDCGATEGLVGCWGWVSDVVEGGGEKETDEELDEG